MKSQADKTVPRARRAAKAARTTVPLALALAWAAAWLAGCAQTGGHGSASAAAAPQAGSAANPSLEQRLRDLQQAEALYLSGQYAQAQAAYEELAHRYPQNPDVWFHLGKAYMKQGRYDDAANALQNSISIEPGHGRAALNLALARLAQAQAAAALARGHLPAGSPERQQAEAFERRLQDVLTEPGASAASR
jgi:tetratricopeptide (TPR) repeat protein